MSLARRLASVSTAVLIALVLDSTASAEGFFLEPKMGFGAFGGDVGDAFTPGFLLGGSVGYELESGLAIEGEATFLLMDVEGGDLSLVYDSAGYLSLLGGLRTFLGGAESPVRPYIGGGVGFSALAWDFTPAAEALLGIDADGVGAFTAVVKGGVAAAVAETLALTFEGRLLVNAWGEKTSEGIPIKTDGHALEVTGGLMISF